MKKADSSWKLSDKDIKFVNRYEKKFFSGELERPLSVYEQKLKQIGCEGCDHVLDVGCGIGQWAIAGAKLNRKVTAFDMRQCRLDVGEKLKSVHKANIEFQLSSMEEFKSPEKFDFIFCYGAFMFLEMDKALEKFSSLLTENGKIYLNYNNLGWYFRMGFSMGLFKLKFNLFIAMFNFMLRSLTGASKNRIVDLSYLKKIAEKNNLRVTHCEHEGHINFTENPINPFYKETYLGLNCVEEAILELKKD